MNFVKKMAVLATSLLVSAQVFADGRDYVYIVGSSTVYPFATVVAERFGRGSDFKTPKVESTGSGGGFKLFCGGVGINHPDITTASRAIKQSEIDLCKANGADDIIEVKIGYDGIVLANAISSTDLKVSLKEIFLALAKVVPNDNGEFILNPYQTWSDINPNLPNQKIEVLGPPPTSGTRDAFVELGMEGGCKMFPTIKALEKTDSDKFKTVCHTIREDGAFVEAGENDNLIVQKLRANPNSFGVFGFSFLDQNTDTVKGATIDGATPSFDAIADGSYMLSRPLFFYVKGNHLGTIPGIAEFLQEFTSERAWGDEGYLAERGLIPLSDEERKEILAKIKR